MPGRSIDSCVSIEFETGIYGEELGAVASAILNHEELEEVSVGKPHDREGAVVILVYNAPTYTTLHTRIVAAGVWRLWSVRHVLH